MSRRRAGMAGLVRGARRASSGCSRACSRKEHARAARCSSRAASSGGISSSSDFRAECPGGDEALQRLIWERLDDALDWLVSLGAEPVWEDTENPRTTGKRFDPRALTELLAGRRGRARVAAAGRGRAAARPRDRRLPGTPRRRARAAAPREPVERRRRPRLRDRARRRDDAGGMDEFYGRAMPAPPARIREEDFVPLSQLYGREARVFTDDGREITPPQVAWYENDLAQRDRPARVVRRRREGSNEHASRPRARGRRDRGRLRRTPRGHASPSTSPPRSRTRSAACASTARARVEGVDGLCAAGVDAGGVALGGYASGLAQALVLGLAAAESIAAGRASRARYAQTRRSPGSGDGAIFVTRSCLPSSSTSAPTDGGSPSCSAQLVAGGLPDEEKVARCAPSPSHRAED